MKYVNVIVKNRSKGVDRPFLYSTDIDDISVGDRVRVPFGKSNKLVEAYVICVMDHIDEKSLSEIDENQIKNIDLVEEKNYFTQSSIKLACWMAETYFTRLLDCLDLFQPSGRRPARVENKKLERTINHYKDFDTESILLNEEQSKVAEIIKKSHDEEDKKFLLKGVTASGKSEIYIEACKSALSRGKRALVVVPEIFLTKQLIEKFKMRFSHLDDKLAIIHSSLKNRELHEEWDKIKSGQAEVIIGSRMAMFAPIDNLGIIIVDEEHSESYKSDRSPKYNAVDVALELSTINEAVLVLGSATPSMRSLKLLEEGKLREVTLTEKYFKGKSIVELVDMRKELRAGNKTVFSRSLYDSILSSLENGEQSLIILGGGGRSFVSCRSCGHVEKCSSCNIPMQYFREGNFLKCNYCGKKAPMIKSCSKCGSHLVKNFGIDLFGLVEETKKFFPSANISSVDWRDSSNIKEISETLDKLNAGEIDILVSTQLLSRGIDFANITTVGVVALDSSINTFDFRGGEKTFQLIVHSIGRAGRGTKEGRVILQTYEDDFYTIEYALNEDVEGFYLQEKKFRESFGYYPFGNMIQLTLWGKNEKATEKEYYNLLKSIRDSLGDDKILGKQFIKSKEEMNVKFHILLKLNLNDMKLLKETLGSFEENRGSSKYTVHFSADLNPKKVWRN